MLMNRYQTTIKTFNNVAEQYWHKFKNFKLYEATYDWFCEHLPDGKFNLLEIACGPGNVSRYLLSKNPKASLLGIDLAPNMITLAKLHNPEAEYRVMDCRDISSLDQSFDAVMCGFCVPYLCWQDCQRLIQDISQLLHPGGLLYISTTAGDKTNEGYQGSESAAGAVYVHFHDIKALKHCIKNADLVILDSKKLTHMHNQQSTKDVFIIAKKPS